MTPKSVFGFSILNLGLCVTVLALDTEDFPFNLPKGSGPWIRPTVGNPWPFPQQWKTSNEFLVIRPNLFQFKTLQSKCELLDIAFKRYYDLVFRPPRLFRCKSCKRHKHWKSDSSFVGYLDTLNIFLNRPCTEKPELNMDEHYELKIDTDDNPGEALLVSQSVWGILRGLETFSQIIYSSPNGIAFQVNRTYVNDFPRFSHRGLLLDTSRHYLSPRIIKKNLDLMAQSKLNVFHWHITDDPSFPFESEKFPQLSALGAFNRYSHTYTKSDVREIIEYARLRGIRVIPEFDTPGHTQSFGNALPQLLTPCFGKDGKPDGTFGPMNPVLNSTYKFMEEFFSEISTTFPDHYLHLGGDEVPFECWASNPHIVDFMKRNGFVGNYSRLEQFYMQKLTDIVDSLQKGYIVWQEVFDNNVELANDTVIHVWKGEDLYSKEMAKVTSAGFQAILSSPWYLNYLHYGIDWPRYYMADPHNFSGSDEQKRLVIGGEACMWGEFVDNTNVIPLTWPRASVVAERLWSAKTVTDAKKAAPRLEEHRCRMVIRGFNVEPSNGVNFCQVAWD
ncbi:beta-hexosaminidase subunit alpha-like [Artemia franciscana]|uniref:Beta-hexosaminidase n=1 Tax=Artemia franciscana TaxID=6661 RepID=A0AA88KWI6_ARTSF|nr:hypothetical protein QYM36_017036 [Artemia franciscana]